MDMICITVLAFHIFLFLDFYMGMFMIIFWGYDLLFLFLQVWTTKFCLEVEREFGQTFKQCWNSEALHIIL